MVCTSQTTPQYSSLPYSRPIALGEMSKSYWVDEEMFTDFLHMLIHRARYNWNNLVRCFRFDVHVLHE